MQVDAYLHAWLRLVAVPDLGRGLTRRLLARFGSPEDVIAASPAQWRLLAQSREDAAVADRAAWRSSAIVDERVAAALDWLAGAEDRHAVALGDAAYPAVLLQTADPPLLLLARGDLRWLQAPALAIVGSRSATAQGLDTASAFARHLADAGLTIISGLARGIDAAAHEGALAATTPHRGATIAVLACGPDIVYPPSHANLADRVAAGGLLLTEHLPGAPPLPANFLQRNRIIAGLSQGTLVVEAALRSGSLTTARQAAEAGREVLAIPGSIHSPQSRGCHALIRQGAKLVESAQDVLSELPPLPASAAMAANPTRASARSTDTKSSRGTAPAGTAPSPASSPPAAPQAESSDSEAYRESEQLLTSLGYDPMDLDTLSARTGWSVAQLSARLLDLELTGRVARLPGGRFQRRASS